MTIQRIIAVKASGFLSPGDPGSICEDAVLMQPEQGIWGVFDGATQITKSYGEANPFTGGSTAAQIARHVFAICGGRTLPDCARQAGSHISRRMEELRLPAMSALDYWSTSCAVARIVQPDEVGEGCIELLQIGDSAIVNIDTGEAYFPEANHDGPELQKIHQFLLDNPEMDHAEAVRLTMPEMHHRRALMNSELAGGYGAIAPNIEGSPHIWQKRIAHPNPGEILNLGIFTDGLHLGASSFDTFDNWEETAQFLRDYKAAHTTANPAMLWLAALSALSLRIKSDCLDDPRGISRPRFKLGGDDQAAIILRITGYTH